jgi:hypothetical protein
MEEAAAGEVWHCGQGAEAEDIFEGVSGMHLMNSSTRLWSILVERLCPRLETGRAVLAASDRTRVQAEVLSLVQIPRTRVVYGTFPILGDAMPTYRHGVCEYVIGSKSVMRTRRRPNYTMAHIASCLIAVQVYM